MELTPAAWNQYSAENGVFESHDDGGSDAWVVAYADLITLLFVFVVLLLSMSEISKAKAQFLSQKFNQKGQTDLSTFKAELDQEIQNSRLTDSVRTEFAQDGLKVQFSEKLLFDSGAADIGPEGLAILSRFSQVLRNLPSQFALAVEGHTDSLPIRNQRFSSNWALSATRAVNVVHTLMNHGFEKSRLSLKAFADTRPVSSEYNSIKKSGGEAWQNNNRRVTLTIY